MSEGEFYRKISGVMESVRATQASKYFDWQRNKSVSENDGCRYQDWQVDSDHFSFARHAKGFKVFLPPDELEGKDEYSSGDPYTVATRIGNEFHRRRIRCTIQLLRKGLNEVSRPKILDLGCGEGHVTAEIKSVYPNAEISALDYSISAICHAVEKYSGIDFCVADAFSPPYSAHYFDAVVCNNLWEHVSDPVLLLTRISRVLKPHGYLIVSTPSRYRFSNLLRLLRGKPVLKMSSHHVTEYSVGQVIDQLTWASFEVVYYYSEPIRSNSQSVKAFVEGRLLLPAARTLFRMLNGRHSLESTVFFLSRKTEVSYNGREK